MGKRRIVLLIGLILLILGGIVFKMLWEPDPVKIVSKSLEKLFQAGSFRYTITQQQWIDGNERLMTQIQGETNGQNTRITGTLIGSTIEMIKAGDALYHKDPFNHKWIKFTGALSEQEVFLAEINPVTSLQFKETGIIVLNGQEKVNGDKAYVCELKPSVQNQLMEEFWTNFEYTLYIRTSDSQLVKVVITATGKTKSEPMRMIMEFRDFGSTIQIQAPSD